MQTELSSGNYDIISAGEAFLFEPLGDLLIKITDENFDLAIRIDFVVDESEKRAIDVDVTDNTLNIHCHNFTETETGLTRPILIATINDRNIYFIFWTHFNDSDKSKTRSVKYSVYAERSS